MERIRWWKC